MQKIKQQRPIHLLKYSDDLKQSFFGLNNILFESEILLKKKKFQFINLNKRETFLIKNFNEQNKKTIVCSIKKKYNYNLLLTNKLNYKLLSHFNKLLLRKHIKNKTIRSRIVAYKYNKAIILIFGLTFQLKLEHIISNDYSFYKKRKLRKFLKLKNIDLNINSILTDSFLSRKLITT